MRDTYCAIPSHLPLDREHAFIDLSEQLQLNIRARDLHWLPGSLAFCDVIAGMRHVELDDAILLKAKL